MSRLISILVKKVVLLNKLTFEEEKQVEITLKLKKKPLKPSKDPIFKDFVKNHRLRCITSKGGNHSFLDHVYMVHFQPFLINR